MVTNRIHAVERLTPESYVRTYQGIVVQVGGVNKVNVMGNVLDARWADPMTVVEGDVVLVQFEKGRNQRLNTCTVISKISTRTRPNTATVTVVPPSSNTVTIVGDDGLTYTATFVVGYTPTVSDNVLITWAVSTTPTIIGKIGATAAPAVPAPTPTVAPPPQPPQTGSTTYWATDSNTYWPAGGWGSWAGGRGRVYQGSYGSGPVYGAYFYNGAPGQLSGRSISNVTLLLGSRVNAGSYNSPVTVHIYATTDGSRPSGNINAVAGPVNVTAWPGQGLTAYNITALAPQLLAGGGLAIFNDPYAGFLGIPEQPDSGRLTFDWSM